MSAKWRAIQHRHRYTYSAVMFPPHFTEALNQPPCESAFFTELMHLISLNSTYAQLEHVKKVAAAFSNLMSDQNTEENAVSCAVKLYLEILFLENSLPLHRTLASALAKCKNYRSLIEDCFRQLCEEYGGGNNASGGKRFCVSRAALSMMSTPKLGYLVQVVEQCAILVGLNVTSGLQSVVKETYELSRPSPIVMEQCQEALSCMYYLLQRFPDKFYSETCGDHGLSLNSQSVIAMAFMVVFSILKSHAFSRDCFVAAGVSFCAALQVCLRPDELGFFIMQGIFYQHGIQDGDISLDAVVEKVPYKGDLADEIHKLSALSRLCLIRGILTAVSRIVLDTHYIVANEGCIESGDGGYTVKTILFDAILPELCIYAENPRDSHSNFHALTVMQICLQQIKTSLLGDTAVNADSYDPIPEEMGARILKIVWNNLEDPLSQTVRQVHLIFDLYLDIQSSLHWAEGSENIKMFLRKIASDLLCLGPRRKGRYIPLASLTRRLGAKTILEMNPNLLCETANAYMDDDVCCAATTFFKCFLECLRDEYWSSDGVESGYAKYRGHCLPPFLQGLAFGVTKLRSNLNTYALPVLLELDVDSIFSMLTLIGIGGDEGPLSASTEISSTDVTLGLEQRIAVLISLLKVSRGLALMEGDMDWYEGSTLYPEGALPDMENNNLFCVVLVKGVEVKIPVEWLILALTHIDESLRMDAAETLFLNPKTASLPSPLELSLMKRAIPLNMRCCSTAFQMKWNSLFRKFFSRVRTALERQLKLGTWKPLFSGNSNGEGLSTGAEKTKKHRAEYLYDFIKWFSRFLFFSCYPSAPYERKTMAMELILILLNVWPVAPTLHGNQDGLCLENNLSPYNKGFTSPDSTLLLVGSIVDSWDRLRECSLLILLYFPTPLPGICSPESVCEAVIWAKKLICSPRVRESDAGALTLRLIFRKYVLDLSWIVQPSCNVVSFCLEGARSNGPYQICTSSPVVSYMTSLIDWLHTAVEDAEKNLSEACKNSFVHGILLALRYTFEELDWNSNVFQNSISEMKHLLERFLELVMRITSLALWVVSADAWYLPDDMEEMMDDEAFSLEIPDEIDSSASESQVEVKVAKAEEEIKPSEQIIMVGCWLAMKEVSLLLGTVIRKVPLPTSDEMKKSISNGADESTQPSNALLDLHQLETIGNHFLEVLLKMKHNGAIDKTRAGFTALCNRLLCSNDPRLCQLTESWMDRLMERTVAKGQTVDDLLRRSAGIPAAFIAFFLSEPEGTPKRLLPRALRWLIGVVTNSLADQLVENSFDGDLCSGFSSKSSQASGPPASGINGNIEISKFRDEGVVPTVHAFNVLKAAFNDTNLATDTSGFCAEALIISIRSFSSPYWEVRNSACLAYTALVRRMIGFLNVQKRQSARRAVTGIEFFHRYPTLHSFLLNELKVATKSLLEGSPDELGSNLKSVVHPSLCPMLILLSRLKPSLISSETGDTLEPFLFMPFIRRCSFQSNLRIRVLAARASTGLVANENLQVVMLDIASELPCERSRITTHDSSSNGAYCSFNTIHGMLLQLNSLLDTNCRYLSDSSKKDTILLELIQILATRSWIGRPRQCPCPILNGCMVKVLDNMFGIAGTCEASRSADIIWNLLWELSSECLDLEPAGSPLYFDPTIQELRKQAATSYFNCIFATSKDIADDETEVRRTFSPPATALSRAVGNKGAFSRFQERLIRSISDGSYEVRIASLKWLFLFLKRGEHSGNTRGDQFYHEAFKMCMTNINLQDTVVKLLISERHHKCMNYLLKVLYIWNSLGFQDNQPSPEPRFICNMDSHATFQLWNNLVSLFKITRHAKTRQTLICCLGMCVKKISSLCMRFISSEVEMTRTAEPIQTDPSKVFSDFYDALSYFVDLIEQNSDASQPVTMRKAAAESIVASGMLTHAGPLGALIYSYPVSDGNVSSQFKPEEAIRLYARKVLDLWLTCIKLLEDEDVNLRKRLALDVQKSLPSREPTQDSPAATGTSQVEKVIESCFGHLSAVFGRWIDYLDYLCCWVMNTANNTNYVASGSGDLVRRVFDKEIDNHHEEKLLICQMCCSHLETILVSQPQAGESWVKSGTRDLLDKWRSRFFEQLIAFVHDHIGKRGNDDWIGGVGNHKDAFLPLYANLAAFYALSNCILQQEPENSRRMLADVSAVGEALSPFLCNPLISSLYSIVVKSHNKYLGETAENMSLSWRENESLWGEFNPYFLLG